MDYLTYGWGVVKENLVGWIIFGLVLAVALSFGIGIFLMPNAFRATSKALEGNTAPEIGDLFNFDNIADDAVAMILLGIAHSIGAMLCGVGVLATAVLFFWVPMLVAEGRYAPMESLKASMAHGKENIGGIFVTVLVVNLLLQALTWVTCGFGGLVAGPVALVAFHKYYADNRDAILSAASAAQIPAKG